MDKQNPKSNARRVAANALNPFAAQLVTKAFMLVYGIVQYRLIGGGEGRLGDYFLAALVFLYTSTVADWGLSTLLTREAAKDVGAEGEQARVAQIFRQTLSVRLLISLTLFVPVGLFVFIYSTFFELSAQGAWATLILTLALLPNAFAGSVTALLYAYERMTLPAVIGVVTAFVNVALGIASLLLNWGIIGLAASAAATTLITALIFAHILRRDFPYVSIRSNVPTFQRSNVGRTEAAALLKTGLPLMLNALLVGLFFRADQFIIKASAPSSIVHRPSSESSTLAVERYQSAYTFLNFVLLITPAVTLALFPRMARHASTDRPRLIYEYTFALKVLLAVSAPIMVLTMWFAPLIITIVTGGKEGYLPEAVALQILIFFLPLSFINGVTQYVLIALDRQSLITRAFAATVAFNVAANLILVPVWGINGAALATILSELVLVAPFMAWTGRELGKIPLAGITFKPLIAGLAVGALGWQLWGVAQSWQTGPTNLLLYASVGLLLAVVYAGVLWLLRPFTKAELDTLRRALRKEP